MEQAQVTWDAFGNPIQAIDCALQRKRTFDMVQSAGRWYETQPVRQKPLPLRSRFGNPRAASFGVSGVAAREHKRSPRAISRRK